MARITVEDCLNYADTRFDLVLRATKRARQIANGAEPMLPLENDKPTVVALREIAEGLVPPEFFDVVEPEPEELAFMDADAVATDADAGSDATTGAADEPAADKPPAAPEV